MNRLNKQEKYLVLMALQLKANTLAVNALKELL